jgi:hypothetical protein
VVVTEMTGEVLLENELFESVEGGELVRVELIESETLEELVEAIEVE